MTLENYDELREAHGNASAAYLMWKSYRDLTNSVVNKLLYKHAYPFPIPLQRDEDTKIFLESLQTLERFAWRQVLKWEKKVDALEATLKTPEARAAEILFVEDGGDSPDFIVSEQKDKQEEDEDFDEPLMPVECDLSAGERIFPEIKFNFNELGMEM